MASSLSTAARPPFIRTLASNSKSNRPKPPRRVNGSLPRKQPSIAEVQRAVGITEDPSSVTQNNKNDISSSSFLDYVSPNSSGYEETSIEKKIRVFAEWFVDQTESNAKSGQQILLVMCLKILPVWLLLLLVASGVIKLPFDLPFMDDLIS